MRTAALIRCLLLVAPVTAPVIASPARAAAQASQARPDSAATHPSGWLVGASVGVPAVAGDAIPELFTIAAHWTHVRPGRLGADISLGTMPRVISEGLVAGFARGGVAFPVRLAPRLFVIPSAGLTVIGAGGAGGGGSTTGISAGLAAVTTGTGPVGLRTSVTLHRFGESDDAVLLWEVGLVRVPWSR